MRNNILKYGLISGCIVVLIPLIGTWVMGTEPETFKMGEIIGYSTMILSMLIIFLAVNEYKKSIPEHRLTFLDITKIGLGISIIAGVMFGLYNVIYVLYIDPDFMDKYFSYYIHNIQNSGQSEDIINQQIKQLEQDKAMFMSPTFNFFMMFLSVFIIGLIVTLISGLAQSDKKQVIPN